MHFNMLLLALALAFGIRLLSNSASKSWIARWSQALLQFALPPLLLLATAIAIVWMGPLGAMAGVWQGWLSYGLSMAFLTAAFLVGCIRLEQGWRSLQHFRSYPLQPVHQEMGRVIPTEVPFAAQVGFWHSELAVSEGLLQELSPDRLEAVLVHERAHRHYRDTFWFFWLGWLRQLSRWLPGTDALWQELLELRELRADAWAAGQVDRLLLAEALFQVASAPLTGNDWVAAFGSDLAATRLEIRIDALIANDKLLLPAKSSPAWLWLLLASLPLFAVPFHA
jgi:Zn-dependent protease with chaperone function